MKILYHHRTASRDGQAVHIDELIGALRFLGHQVHVVAPVDEGLAQMGTGKAWVSWLRAHMPKPLYEALELAYSLSVYRRLSLAARKFQPDFIYERYNLFLFAGLMLKRRHGIPMLLEVNAPLAEERARFGGLGLPRLANWAEGVVWRGADMVLPVTRVLGTLVAARGVAMERIAVIPNGINPTHFGAVPSPGTVKAALGWEDALVLGFTGFVREWHGVDRVLRWMASADAPAVARLLLVGDGPARGSLERLSEELALSDRVRFTGIVSREQVPAYVSAFDVALQPAAVPYASPLKLFEYMALGKAIVAPRQPNVEEVLTDDLDALLFDASANGAFEQVLTRLCHDATLRERIGGGAAATIIRLDLTWVGNARRVVALATPLCVGAPALSPARAPAAEQ
jgi:glycosyltransferase involved in cell wall biosynthesis